MKKSVENSVVSCMGRRPGLFINGRITRMDILKLVNVLLTWPVVLDMINAQFKVCKHVFDRLAVKRSALVQGDYG